MSPIDPAGRLGARHPNAGESLRNGEPAGVKPFSREHKGEPSSVDGMRRAVADWLRGNDAPYPNRPATPYVRHHQQGATAGANAGAVQQEPPPSYYQAVIRREPPPPYDPVTMRGEPPPYQEGPVVPPEFQPPEQR
jgi:hypothetical protein